MQVLFNAPKEIITVPEQKITTQVINIDIVVDFPEAKRVQAQTKELKYQVIERNQIRSIGRDIVKISSQAFSIQEKELWKLKFQMW